VPVIGVKIKKFMSKTIQYSDEPIGEVKLIPDFLPSPEELALKQKNAIRVRPCILHIKLRAYLMCKL